MGPQAAGYDADAAADESARLTQAREQLAVAKRFDEANEQAMHEDALMLVGGLNQWDAQAVRERGRLGRPLYTGNRFPAMLAQITGEIRRNRPSIKCAPGDALATPRVAQVFEGLIRSIERLSQANLAYARVGKAAASVGKGHMRIVPVYADDESFDVELRIRAIKNIYSVKWDPSAQAPDKSDANWCFITSEVGKKEFEEAYPTVGAAAWAKAQATARRTIEGWRSGEGDKVTVCEQWVVKKEPYQRYRLAHTRATYNGIEQIAPSGQEVEIDGDVGGTIDGAPADEWLAAAQARGLDVVQTRTAYKRKICMYLWGGEKQIAGPIEWKGARIPIFTCLGEETDVGEETVLSGIIRHAKDAQKLHNYARSADLELVSMAPKSPIIVGDNQIEAYEDEWALAAKQPVPYLRYTPQPNVPAPQERSGPGTNPGPQSLAQAGVIDMQDVVGIHDASLGKRSNETSGVAIEARDAQADTGTYVYLDNLNSTIESLGTELVNAIPHYYSTRKQIMILGADDAPAIIDLASQGIDLKLGKYHVIAQRGPSYQSKREKAADQLIQLNNALPEWARPLVAMRVAVLTDMEDAEEFIAEMRAVGEMIGALPPMQQPGAMPGAPGAMAPGPQGPEAALPPNVLPFAQPNASAPVSMPPSVPAGRQHVGDGRMPAAPPGM